MKADFFNGGVTPCGRDLREGMGCGRLSRLETFRMVVSAQGGVVLNQNKTKRRLFYEYPG
jgi:hypothetical protein